jgi:hypothetical protein
MPVEDGVTLASCFRVSLYTRYYARSMIYVSLQDEANVRKSVVCFVTLLSVAALTFGAS